MFGTGDHLKTCDEEGSKEGNFRTKKTALSLKPVGLKESVDTAGNEGSSQSLTSW
jgi:hypothetical protein